MKLGLPMNVGSPSILMKTSTSTATIEGEQFGKVFQNHLSASAVPAKSQIKGVDQELTKLLDEVLNTDSLEELEQTVKSPTIAQLLKETGMLQNTPVRLTDLSILEKLPSLQQLAHIMSEKPDKLIETITNVLEDAGMSKEQLDQMAATGDIWFVLDALQKLPAEKFQAVIENIPPKDSVELMVLLKAIELAAPEMDLYTKQVDLVKMIHPILSQFSSQLEQMTVQPLKIPPAMQHIIRFMTEQSTADTMQQDQQSKPSETVAPISIASQTGTTPVFQMNASEKVPESRSEALMREFQAVLNRANFGQTNGMNRISIKLYPEHLGQVRIELLEVNGVMTARILASTAMAREMLDSQMHQLRHAFNQQNLQVERIDLSQTLQDPSKSDREQAFNKQNQQQKDQAAKQNENQDEQEQTFREFMIELEV
ncbi:MULTISPECIES: flagellar hook-length control protein FliK [unclassified Sporosarcina]|uniref:flagellar hook-length control protein FliK n=1 Tax=unclassified Sporosarcina TaxID=2647733 RepID=UPI0013046714|nr:MULTISPECIES: flagellar hook-length control protein FliK [unclassified Sporosarcina]